MATITEELHGNPFYRMAIKDVLSILDSLEVKEVDLNNINIEEVKAAAKAWSEDDENTRGCDYIGAVVAEHAFVACAEWLINKAQKGK